MDGQTPRQLASEFGAVRKMREDIQKPVWHNSLRLPAGDSLTDEKWNAIAISYMKKMGFTEAHQYCVVLHNDEEGQHVHIIANRVGVNGSVYLGQNENLKSTSIISELEHIYGLTVTKGAEYKEGGAVVKPGVKAPTKSEIEEALRTGIEPPRQQLQRIIDTAMTGKPTAPQFCERLVSAGIEVRANISPTTGKLNGFSFSINGAAFKASDLGDRYKWANLSKEVGYEQARDCEVIQRYRSATPDSADGISDARANRPLTEAYGTHERVPDSGGQADNLIAAARSRTGNTTPSACTQHHKEVVVSNQPKLIIADTVRVRGTTQKIDWLDFNAGDSTYYYKNKAGSLTPMVKEVPDGLQLVGRVAPSKCRAMLDIMKANAWSRAVVSGGDAAFQEAMLNEALNRDPLPNLRFTNTEIELRYQAHIRGVSAKPNTAFRLPHSSQQERTHNQTVR